MKYTQVRTLSTNSKDTKISLAEVIADEEWSIVFETMSYILNKITKPPPPIKSEVGLSAIQMLRNLKAICSSTNYIIRNIDCRIGSIENQLCSNIAIIDSSSIDIHNPYEDVLPIKDIDSLLKFELELGNDDALIRFSSYLSRIGGNNVKDNISRCLKSVYSNELGMKCSWLGKRNNFRMCDLKTMRCIKSVIVKSYGDIREKEFEHIAADWIRQSKVRFTREPKVT